LTLTISFVLTGSPLMFNCENVSILY